ncbi:MAG: efflux RND transporter permease subunit [Treponema sp.]|nr:efflux RND transporter permease subunit [Treponema sp.]
MSVAAGIVKRPVLGVVVFALIAILGLVVAFGIPIEMLPDLDPPFILVVTPYRGAGPETVENAVTSVLEAQLATIAGLQGMRSISSESLSLIVLEFEFGANLDARTNDARDRIDRVRIMLPDGVDAPMIQQVDVNAEPLIRVAVQGDRTVNELQEIAEALIIDRLDQVDGVATTAVIGGSTRQVRVEISQNRLEAYGLTITGIAGILAAQNLELGAGTIVDGARNYGIRTTGEFRSIQDIAETVIARRGGADIRLLDIGEVRLAYPRETSSAYINGEPGIFIAVTNQSGTNSVEVADRVYERLEEIARLLPQDIRMEIVQDGSTQVRNMMDELVNSALLGGILAMAILLLFLRNIKSTIIIGISIPFSVLVTLLVMNLAGLTLNMLTMAGLILGIGLVVDCSIVILENIFKYRERGARPDVAAILGSQEVLTSIVAATVTTLCVFVPVLLFQNELGFIGMILRDLIVTVAISLASSLLIAVFLVPILASKYLVLKTREEKPLRNRALIKIDGALEYAIRRLTGAYTRALAVAMQKRLATSVIVIAVFVLSILAMTQMRFVMAPPMNEDSFTLNVELPLGTIYEDTKATLLQVQEIAMSEIVGIKNIVTEIWQSEGSINITMDMGLAGADTSEQAQNRLRARFGDFPNAVMSFSEGMAGGMFGGADIDIALRVNDIAEGFRTAVEIRDIIEAAVPEFVELSVDMNEGLPQVEVVIDRNRAYSMGLSVAAIAREIAAAMNGVTATTFRYGGREYAVVLDLQEEDRQRLSDMERIFIASNIGHLVPLSNFATLERGLGPVEIRRQDQARIIRVTGTLTDSGMAAAVEDRIRNILDAEFIMPDGVILAFEGQAGQVNETMLTFLLVIALAILLVFGTMAGVYESFKTPFINLFTIPFMLIGVILIHIVMGQDMSMFTMIGLVMLTGIVINNGIILVDYTNLLIGRGVPVTQACLEAGEARLRPVLMTVLTTILGLVPMAFFPGSSAGFIQPIGLTVIGGLLSSTFITLFFVPILYSVVNGNRGKVEKKLKAAGQIAAEPEIAEALS